LIEQDDEAIWDEQFAKSQDVLKRLADQAMREHAVGETEDFDPDNDSDAP